MANDDRKYCFCVPPKIALGIFGCWSLLSALIVMLYVMIGWKSITHQYDSATAVLVEVIVPAFILNVVFGVSSIITIFRNDARAALTALITCVVRLMLSFTLFCMLSISTRNVSWCTWSAFAVAIDAFVLYIAHKYRKDMSGGNGSSSSNSSNPSNSPV
ncbi:Uncharacterized protein PBTT_03036 [Plasmodiophora brassicae]|uniref:Uncharacterized protein n=1 Tax=Plasmodiophora brassicae TaxID=37360 RepID=A0A0G4J6U2_PLABS|nr:hypothetical protein PBRA_003040 [Plasmodiophora brassicae]SPQ95516.1 unnamed protein product [Plasmodiophora brassicae]